MAALRSLLCLGPLLLPFAAWAQAPSVPLRQGVQSSCAEFNALLNQTRVAGRTIVRFGTHIEGAAPTYSIRAGQRGAEVCATVMARGSMSVLEMTSDALAWQPGAAVSSACLGQRNAWNNQVFLHEQRHMFDARSVAQEFTQRIERPLQACAANRQDAEMALADMVRRYSKQISDQAQAEFDRRSQAFHSSRDGSPIAPLDCSIC